MTSFNKRVYEMLIRIRVFAARYQNLFAAGSPAKQLFDEIEGSVQKLAASKNSQTAGDGDVRRSSQDRALARQALRNQLLAISRTAQGLGLSDFWLARDKGDRALVDNGHRFIERAEPLKTVFIAGHLPPDFIEQLKTAVEKLEKIIADQFLKEGSRIAATSAIDEARNAALSALQRLNPLMENLLRDDPPALRLWQSARHIERYSRSYRAEPDANAEDPPPILNDSAAAVKA